MTTYTRRDLGKLMLTALPLAGFSFSGALAAQTNNQIAGLQFGIETFSFHDLPPAGDPQLIPTIIRNMNELGPRGVRNYVGARRALRKCGDRLVGAIA